MQAIKVIKESFIKFYDDLFKYVLLNIVWFGLFIIPFLLTYIHSSLFFVGIVYLIVFAGPIIISGMENINMNLEREENSIKMFLRGIKLNFKKGIKSFIFTAFIYAVLVLDLVFFVQRSQDNYFMMIIAIFFFYMFILFSIMQIYYWGLLIVQKDLGFWELIKRSFLLVIDNILPSIIMFILLVIVLALNIVLTFIAPFFIFTLVSLISLIMTKRILEKYEEINRG